MVIDTKLSFEHYLKPFEHYLYFGQNLPSIKCNTAMAITGTIRQARSESLKRKRCLRKFILF